MHLFFNKSILTFVIFLFLTIPVYKSFASTIDVCSTGCTYSTITGAITSAVSGDTIAIGAGTYTVTSTMAVSKSLTFQGDGSYPKIFFNVVGTSNIFNVTADNVTFKNLEIYSPISTNGTRSNYAVMYTSGSGLLIDDCKIHDVRRALQVSNGNTFTVQNSELSIMNRGMIEVNGGTGPFIITRNWIHDSSYLGGSTFGILTSRDNLSGGVAEISYNYIEGTRSAIAYTPSITNAPTSGSILIDHNTIDNTWISTNSYYNTNVLTPSYNTQGIAIYDPSGYGLNSTKVTIRDNIIENTKWYGTHYDGGTTGILNSNLPITNSLYWNNYWDETSGTHYPNEWSGTATSPQIGWEGGAGGGSISPSITTKTIDPLFVGGTKTIASLYYSLQDGSPACNTALDGKNIGAWQGYCLSPVTIGPLHHFVIDTISTQTENTPFDINMTAKDLNGNTVTDFVSTVNLTTGSGTITPTTSAAFTSGTRTETVTLTGSGFGRTITATRTGGAEAGTSNVFTVNSAATKFVIINPTDNIVGNDVTVRIEVQDASNNIVTTYNNAVTLNTSGNAKVNHLGNTGLVNIINGIGNIPVSDTTAETVDLSLSDTSSTGLDYTSTQDVVFVPGNLHHFILDSISSPEVAGENITATITAKDIYGNTVPSFIGKVDFSTTTGGSITPTSSDNFVAGILTQSVQMTLAGNNKTITVTRQGGSENGTSNSFTISPGSTYRYILNTPSDILTGTRAGYTVTRQDKNNNLVTNGTDTVYLYASTGTFYDTAIDGNILTQIDITDKNSSANLWYLGDVAGSKQITASDSTSIPNSTGIIDATDSIEVTDTPIVATRFIVLDVPSQTAGDTISVHIQAQNDAGSVDTGYNGTVNLLASGSLPRPIPETLTPGGIVSIVNGEGTINIIDTKAETITLSLSSPSTALDISSVKTINFSPGVFSYFTMDSIATSPSAGVAFPVTITAKDANGNVATSFTGTVDFTTTSGTITPLISNNFVAGILAQNVTVTGAGTGKTITATKTSDTQYFTSNTFEVLPGLVSSFTVEASGGGDITLKTINVPFDLKITAKDLYGNIATGFTGTADITSTGTFASGSGSTPPFTQGVLSTRSVTISNSGTFTITVTRTGGTEIGVSNSFNVSPLPIVATKIIIINPSDVQVGSYTVVTVEAVDDLGNRDDTYNGNINLFASGSATGGGLVNIVNGAGTRTLTDTNVETVILSLSNITPPVTLDITSTQDVVFLATPPSGGGGGGASVIIPVISFTGKAFPLANIEIMAISKGLVPISSNSNASNTGNFKASYTGQLPSDVNTFSIVVYDKNKNIVQTKIFKLGVNDKLLQTILMAPTLILNQSSATLGTFMGISGFGMPKYKIELMIDGAFAPETTTVDTKGNYNLTFNTYRLGLGEHTLRVRQVDTQGKSSDYSIDKSFLLTKLFNPKADFNGDGKVDITDWSIFISRYNSINSINRKDLDLNNDGIVDIKDLSLFIEALKQ